MNPLEPLPVDVVLASLASIATLLAVAALVSWAVLNRRLRLSASLMWIAVIVLLPFVGAVAWFIWVFRVRRERSVSAT